MSDVNIYVLKRHKIKKEVREFNGYEVGFSKIFSWQVSGKNGEFIITSEVIESQMKTFSHFFSMKLKTEYLVKITDFVWIIWTNINVFPFCERAFGISWLCNLSLFFINKSKNFPLAFCLAGKVYPIFRNQNSNQHGWKYWKDLILDSKLNYFKNK